MKLQLIRCTNCGKLLFTIEKENESARGYTVNIKCNRCKLLNIVLPK